MRKAWATNSWRKFDWIAASERPSSSYLRRSWCSFSTKC